MIRYVKICPKCGHANEEGAYSCAKCPEFFDNGLGAVPLSEPDAGPAATAPEVPVAAVGGEGPMTTGASPQVSVHVGSASPGPVTQRMDGQSVLILRSHAGGQSFSVRSGLVVGQAHPSRPAGVQLAGVPGCACIHRHHCIFQRRGGQWLVQAIDQRQFGKREGETNPTAVNGALVAPGAEHLVRDGDLLTLAGVNFTVNIIGA